MSEDEETLEETLEEAERPEEDEGPETPGAEEATQEPVLGRWTAALTVVLIFGVVYAVALFLTAQGDTVPGLSPAPVPAAVADGFHPLSVAFFDEMHGLISGTAPCAPCAGQRGGVIASTSDGGRTWSVRFRGGRPILGLTRTGMTNNVWATATSCDNESFIDCQLFRLHSSDLGQTWNPDRPKNPYVVSPPGARSSCNQDHPYPVSSSFATRSRAWMLCAMDPISSTYQFKGLFETTDAGRHWAQRAHFHPVTGGATTNLGDMPIDGFAGGISFMKSGTGWLWTLGPNSSLSGSTDSGNHWKALWRSSDPSDPSGRQIVAASLTSQNIGYAVFSSHSTGDWLMVTHDGAQSWEPAQSWPTLRQAGVGSTG
jgi:hypothetical protein